MADAVARPGASGKTGGTGGSPGEPGKLARFVEFCQGVMVEMRKVTWPDLPQVRSATVMIIIFVLIIALLITVLDFVLQGVLIKMIPSLFAGR